MGEEAVDKYMNHFTGAGNMVKLMYDCDDLTFVSVIGDSDISLILFTLKVINQMKKCMECENRI